MIVAKVMIEVMDDTVPQVYRAHLEGSEECLREYSASLGSMIGVATRLVLDAYGDMDPGEIVGSFLQSLSLRHDPRYSAVVRMRDGVENVLKEEEAKADGQNSKPSPA